MQFLHVDRKGELVIGYRAVRVVRSLGRHVYAGVVALAMAHAWAVVA